MRLVDEASTPFGDRVLGVQLVPGGFVALGSDVGQAHSEPRDWRERLVWWSRAQRRWSAEARLPAGNWRLVRGGVRDARVVLFDLTEAQGALGFDRATAAPLWHAPLPSLRRLLRGRGGTLVALTADELFLLDENDGLIRARTALPLPETHAWTVAALLDEGRLLLGGRLLDGRAWQFARFHPPSGAVEIFAELAWSAVADAELIANCEADGEHCGFDLGDVANLVLDGARGDRALVALGGDGDMLGACQGASALGLLSLSDGALEAELIDRQDGSSGLIALADGLWLSDCGGTLRLVTLR